MPFSVQHHWHRYTLIPKVLYVHRIGKRLKVTFGPGERVRQIREVFRWDGAADTPSRAGTQIAWTPKA